MSEQKSGITMKRFMKAAEGSNGLISIIATKLQVHRSTLRRWIKYSDKRQKKVDEIIAEESSELLDIAQEKMKAEINDGNWKAVRFLLETKGKHLGYTKMMETQHTFEKKSLADLLSEPIDNFKPVKQKSENPDDY
jgi:transposase-like protein